MNLIESFKYTNRLPWMQLTSMIELPKYNFGLKEYIETENLGVREDSVGRYTKLTLEYPSKPNGYRRGPVDVILSGDYVLGAKSRQFDNTFLNTFLVGIAFEQIRSFAISFEPDIKINVCARETSQECPSFESFLTLNPFYLPKGINNARVNYTQHNHNGELTPEFFSFGDDSVVGFHNGIAYIPNWGKNKVQIPKSDNGTFTAARKIEPVGELSVSFPESIPEDEVRKLEEILRTDIEWLHLMKEESILKSLLSYSIRKPISDFSSN